LQRFITNESILNGTVWYLRNGDTFQIVISKESVSRNRMTKRNSKWLYRFVRVW